MPNNFSKCSLRGKFHQIMEFISLSYLKKKKKKKIPQGAHSSPTVITGHVGIRQRLLRQVRTHWSACTPHSTLLSRRRLSGLMSLWMNPSW